MVIEKDHLWAPIPDNEMIKRGTTFIRDFNLHDTLLKGGASDLSKFSATSKLYILAHGHSKMPFFSNGNGKWDATQLASMLEGDGLPKHQRDIELLVCHAGESVNNKSAATKLVKICENAKKASDQNKSKDKFIKSFNKVSDESGTEPTFFETDPENLLVPLAAQLTQALKSRKYTNIRIISYKCPVAQYSQGGEVYLDLTKKGGGWGVKAKDNPTYRVTWL
jgi:hypothetical protein